MMTNWLTGALGAALRGYGAAQQQSADQRAGYLQRLAQTWTTARKRDMEQQVERTSAALDADPLGASQRYAQRSALLAAILPNLQRPTHSVPGDPAVAAQVRPTNLPTPMLTGVNADGSLQALARRDIERANLDPNTPATDLGAMFGAEAAPYANALQRYLAMRRAAAQREKANRNAAFDI